MKPLRILLVDYDASIGALQTETLDEMCDVVRGIRADAVQAALRD